MSTFFGKYRGIVVDNADPLELNRVTVTVPQVSLGASAWATPCLPIDASGDWVAAVPPVGAAVWVEYEAGDPDLPIWVGGFFAAPELPDVPDLPDLTPPSA